MSEIHIPYVAGVIHSSFFYIKISWGTGTECDDGCTGTVSTQTYTNTVITLESADTTFGDTIASAGGATYSGLSSSNGGAIWKISKIVIPPMTS